MGPSTSEGGSYPTVGDGFVNTPLTSSESDSESESQITDTTFARQVLLVMFLRGKECGFQ